MKKVLLRIVVIFVLLAIVLGAFVLGQNTQRERFAAELDATQAMLMFNHLLRYREIERDLSKGCASEALEKTKISIDRELKLLSSIEKSNSITWINKYISDRDPELLNQLKTFKSQYGESWTEPICKK